MTNYEFDNAYRDSGAGLFCGVDEAGRGPLAGPVYAAAVISRRRALNIPVLFVR